MHSQSTIVLICSVFTRGPAQSLMWWFNNVRPHHREEPDQIHNAALWTEPKWWEPDAVACPLQRRECIGECSWRFRLCRYAWIPTNHWGVTKLWKPADNQDKPARCERLLMLARQRFNNMRYQGDVYLSGCRGKQRWHWPRAHSTGEGNYISHLKTGLR